MDRPDATATRRELVILGLASVALLTALVAALGLARLVAQRWVELPEDVPYGGWLVDAVAATLGAVVLAVGWLGGRAARRRWGSLRERTPHRRAVVLVALVPSLLLGAGTAEAMAAALHTTSNRTPAAAAARAWQAAYRKAPLVPDASGQPAPAGLAAVLLRAEDLGPGWYDFQRPNVLLARADPRVATPTGQVAAAHLTLQLAHWDGTRWELDALATEHLRRFRTAAEAEHYLAEVPPDVCDCGATGTTWNARTVDGVRLWQEIVPSNPPGGGWHTPSGRPVAGFVVGTDAFVVRLSAFETHGATTSTTSSRPDVLLHLARAAMRRATTTR